MTSNYKNMFILPDACALCGGNTYSECSVVCNSLSVTDPFKPLKTNMYLRVNDNASNLEGKNIYLANLNYAENAIEKIIDYYYSNNARLMISLSETLEEVGLFDAKFKLSPIMYLHKLGLIENSIIVGGVYLDKDDVSLMVQENCSLVLTPSYSLGNGHGIPNVTSYIKQGLKINLGVADCAFNKSGNMLTEAYLLYMSVCANMNKSNALSFQQLSLMLADTDEYADELNKSLFEF